MPAQPSNGFLNTQPDPLHTMDLRMLAERKEGMHIFCIAPNFIFVLMIHATTLYFIKI
jgi:hypothetical protein